MDTSPGKTHPLIIAAAIAVIVACLAIVANLTGLLPGKSGSESPSTAAAAPPAADAPAPTPPAPIAAAPEAPARPPAPAPQAAPQPAANAIPAPPAGMPPPPPPATCRDCGTVKSIRTVSTQGQGTGLGAVAGGVIGGVLGHQIGKGHGNTVATVAGAAGGAYAGHQVEKNVRSDQYLEVSVRFDDGKVRSFRQDAGARWQVGDRVRQTDGGLVPY